MLRWLKRKGFVQFRYSVCMMHEFIGWVLRLWVSMNVLTVYITCTASSHAKIKATSLIASVANTAVHPRKKELGVCWNACARARVVCHCAYRNEVSRCRNGLLTYAVVENR